MTCMKQEFCIHEKYCQGHIGQNFDSCILFSRNSKPMTNEEWLRQCSTEELAELLFQTYCDGRNDAISGDWEGVDTYELWLKEKHK